MTRVLCSRVMEVPKVLDLDLTNVETEEDVAVNNQQGHEYEELDDYSQHFPNDRHLREKDREYMCKGGYAGHAPGRHVCFSGCVNALQGIVHYTPANEGKDDDEQGEDVQNQVMDECHDFSSPQEVGVVVKVWVNPFLSTKLDTQEGIVVSCKGHGTTECLGQNREIIRVRLEAALSSGHSY